MPDARTHTHAYLELPFASFRIHGVFTSMQSGVWDLGGGTALEQTAPSQTGAAVPEIPLP